MHGDRTVRPPLGTLRGHDDGRRSPRRIVVMAMALLAGLLVALPTTPAQAVEDKPVVVLLCHGNNQAWPENLDESYFEDLFTETAGSESIADYWRDISQGELSIDNSVVVDVEVPVSRDAIGDRDDDDYEQCRDAAIDQGLDMTGFAGLIVFKPQTEGRTVDAIDTDDTTIRVDTRGPSVVGDWPSPPFSLVLTATGSLWNTDNGPIENVLVTAVSVDTSGIVTFTVERGHDDGYRGRSWDPSDWPANTIVKDVVDIYGRTGTLVVPAATSPTIIAHEFGHFLGFAHSRVLSTATTDYGDCFDIMSAASCPSYYFDSSFDFPGGSISQDNGPGMTAILLDREGWLPAADIATFSAPSCDQQTFALRGLGLAGSALQEVRVPVTSQISVDDEDGTVVTSDYLSIELRSRMFPWDQGFPRDAFVLHLKGDDGRAYLVDDVDAGGQRGMIADDTFLFGDDTSDPSDDRYIYVNDIDATTGTGEITIGTCPLQSDLDYTGPVEFTAQTRPDVTAEWSWHDAAAGPSIEVDFALDDADCWDIISRSEVDDGVGSADCDLDTLTMLPGTYTLTASWDGKDDGFFAPVEDSVEVTVVKRATELDVEVPVDTAYHDRVTLRATLSEAPHPDDASPDGISGEQVELSIGDGGTAQACSATTTSSGTASCIISSVEQVPGSVAVRASFAGTTDYLPSSDVDSFTVTRRATIVDVDVPATTTYHDPVTLSATLEEAPGAAGLGDPVAGRDVELSIGSGATAQACTATTAPDGSVACTIPSVEQVPGSVAVQAAFSGDVYYLPSSDSDTFTVARRETAATVAGPDFAASGGALELTGTIVEVGGTLDGAGIAGRDLLLSLGEGADVQTCTGTTDASGVATCAIAAVDVELGPQPIGVAFAGDEYYLPSGDDDDLIVFAWMDGGHFVVGDTSAVVGESVTFWSSELSRANEVSGGLAPDAFKGFADHPVGPTDCAADWRSSGGDSAGAGDEVPAYTAVLVTDLVSKRGRTIQDTTTSIVIVDVDSGYQSDPGHPGTATVVGTLCTD